MSRELSAIAESFALARPFRISRGVKTSAEVVTVTISENGFTGRGEGVPYPRYGESPQSALAEIEAQRAALEAGAGREDMLAAMTAGAARNAVDCALWDLEMQRAGTNIFTALGIEKPARLPTAMTVSLDSPERMGAAAAALAEVPLLKVKLDKENPEAQLEAVRAAAPKPRLIADPNESWDMLDVAGLQDVMLRLRVDLLEQPLAADEDYTLADYVSSVPVAADESIHASGDLAGLTPGYDVINIKLDKTGGLTEALRLAERARSAGYRLMTGCMICSSLSAAPAMVIAALSEFVDLDGPEWLADDRAGGVQFDGGYVSGPVPGFWGGPAT